MPGGTTRVTVQHDPTIYIASAKGAWLTDVDGNRYLDFNNNYTTLIHGHAFPPVIEAVARQLERGTCFANPTAFEIELAEILCARVPGVERIRFTTTGTEAVMFAIKAARALTGRTKVAKFDGAYHGAYDWVELSENGAPEGDDAEARDGLGVKGTPVSVLSEVIIVPFNDLQATVMLLERHARELACLVIDLVPSRAGLIPLEADYVETIARVCQRHGILLISDEILNFRQGYQGAAARFELVPDLVTLGKIIGGGLPAAAIGGPADLMAVFDSSAGPPGVSQGGTFAANPLSMVAGIASMGALDQTAFQHLERLGLRARKRLSELIADRAAPMHVTGLGSLFRVHVKPKCPRTYREARPTPAQAAILKRMSRSMLGKGVMMPVMTSCSCSTVMTEADIDFFLEAFSAVLSEEKEALATL